MTDQRYYSGLKEVRIAETIDEINGLLMHGWELLRPVELNDGKALTRIHYIMGRFAGSNPATSTQQSAAVPTGEILGLPWEDSNATGVDKWVPSNKVPASISSYFKEHGKRTDRGSYGVEVENFTVYLGSTGNLSRYKKK